MPVHEVGADSVWAVIPSRDEVLAGPDIEQLEAPELLTRPAAEFVVDLSGMSLEHYLSEVQPHECHGTYRNRFNDVLLFGYHHFHGVISGGQRIDCQVSDSVRDMVDIHIDNHPGADLPIPQIWRDSQGYRLSCAALTPTDIAGRVHFGTPTEPLNWGLWLLQGIPSAMDFLDHHTADRFFAFVERDWQRRLLNTLGIPDEALVHQQLCHTYRCESLVLNQYTHLDLVPSLREREIFQRIAHELAAVRSPQPRRRIFVSRRSTTQQSNGRYRALQNEGALLGALAARNYHIVEPELLPFPEQIRLFAEAELVVGLGGAGLFNVVFCAPGTRVVSIESSTSFVHSHAQMFGGLGLPFGIIFGRQDLTDQTPVQKRWSLDVAGVIKALQRFE
jgi:capsular polysaccharide biosynthesis protein